MAEALGIAVVAEGVETNEQLARLGLLGYDLTQGYLFAPPRPAVDIRPLLARGEVAAVATG